MKCQVICTVLLAIGAVSAYVEELDDTFTETEDEMWLIQFYAPWCTYCKEMDPVWYEVGAELKSLGSAVNVGRVDATAHTGIAKQFRVGGYPAIKMSKDNVKYNYRGPRTKDGILDFANRISGPLVRALTTQQLFLHVMSRHDVLFVYIGGASSLKTDYTVAAKELIVHTYFFSASRDVLPKAITIPHLPAVAVFKDGTYFTYDEEEDGNLVSWINRERFLYYLKLDTFTLYSLGDSGKLVVLAVLDEKKPSKNIWYKATVEKVSGEFKELYRKELQFGHMDGNEYINGLIMGELTMPSFVVLNMSNDSYFLPPDEVETEEQLVQFIQSVLDGSIVSQGGNGIFQRMQRLIYNGKMTLLTVYTKAPRLGAFFLVLLVCGLCILFYCLYKFCICSEDKETLTTSEDEKEVEPQHQRKKSSEKKTD